MGGAIKGVLGPIQMLGSSTAAVITTATWAPTDRINTGNFGVAHFYVDYTKSTDTGLYLRYQTADRLSLNAWYYVTNMAGTITTTNLTANGRYCIPLDVNDAWVRILYYGSTSGASLSGSVSITATLGE